VNTPKFDFVFFFALRFIYPPPSPVIWRVTLVVR